ncbi:MAG: hypothetical protein COB15_08590 [Flavobacteriales bacterium]|nr:MAG: hypothetical protein COB15_08590 [Flavobacteriales bacterium]
MGLNHDIVKAVKQGNLELVKNLLNNGAEINTTVSDSSKKRKLIHHASQKGYTELVQFLIDKGALVNDKDSDGKTPLWYAAEENNYEVAKILINNNAEVNITGDWNPLDRAAECSYDGVKVINLLISNGADVNLIVGGTNHIALVSALRQEKIEATKILIEKGSNINHQNANGETPTMQVAYYDREEHLQLLLKNGATIKGRNHFSGDEILHNAAFGGYSGMIKILVEKGAGLNPINKQGETPLHIAVILGKIKAVKTLLDLGAKSDIKDNNGNTPLDMARDLNKGEKIIKLFDNLKTSNSNTTFWSNLKRNRD